MKKTRVFSLLYIFALAISFFISQFAFSSIAAAATTTDISTAAATLNSIAITTPASKLTYTVGDTLDITGMVVTGTYSDGSTKVETVTTADVTGFDSTAPATGQVLTVTVGGQTATFTVDIQAAPSSIAITTPASKLTYTVGDVLDLSGLVVTGTYSDGSTKVEKVTTANVTGFDSTAPATGQVLTVTVGGQTATFTVDIQAAPSSIAITTPASKLTYTVGDTLDITGLVVTGTYSDGSTKVETVTTADVTGFDSTAPATGQVLTITVGGQTATFMVDIQAATPAATLNSIAITTPASKLTYTVGDTLDITGLVVTGTYSDGSTKVETVTTADVTGFDSTAPATGQVLTVTVGGQTATFTVDIQAATPANNKKDQSCNVAPAKNNDREQTCNAYGYCTTTNQHQRIGSLNWLCDKYLDHNLIQIQHSGSCNLNNLPRNNAGNKPSCTIIKLGIPYKK